MRWSYRRIAETVYQFALLERSKSDPLDARVLLEFLRRIPFQPWQPPAGSNNLERKLLGAVEEFTRGVAQSDDITFLLVEKCG